MKEFAGKTAVITGAASGIGLALSQLFLERGMNVVMSDVETQALTDAAQQLDQGDACHIMNTASMAGLTTLPFYSIYCLSKAAALYLSECMHKELEAVAPQIGVSALCPELIDTGIATARRNRPAKYPTERRPH